MVLMLLQLGKEEGEEALSALSSDAADDRACSVVSFKLMMLVVLCRWRREPKAATGHGR